MGKRLLILFILTFAALTSCKQTTTLKDNSIVDVDLDSILERGKLVALVDFNSTDYFLYKGEPMGFYYEMLYAFAAYLNVDLEIVIGNDVEESIDLLNSGKVDLIASGLCVNAERKQKVLFSEPIMQTRQVLIQRKPRNWRTMTQDAVDRQLIRNQLDLAHKTVYIERNAVHHKRLSDLSSEIGDTINVIELPFGIEEIIKGVAYSDIDYAVADENVAMVNATYYPDIDISTPVSFPQKVAWGMRKSHSERLETSLNKWLMTYMSGASFANLYAKYFNNSRSSIIVNSDYYTINTGKISRWDDLIKEAGKEIDWDWRLLSSLVYQESHFDPDVISWAGAFGLMQIMPATGTHFGSDITSATPAENISVGIQYLEWLDSYFADKVVDDDERLKFVLASYNAGPGHILDAMRLAEKNGKDPLLWDDNVAEWLAKKSDPEVYRDSVVRNGYARGSESVNYVDEILKRYEHYKNIVSEDGVDNRLTFNTINK